MKRTSKKQAKDLRALAALPDHRIDLSDIPEVRDWPGAVVGKFYRTTRKSLTIRLDADVLAWLRSNGPGYQTRINKLLRSAMASKSPRRPPWRDTRPTHQTPPPRLTLPRPRLA